MNKFLRDRKKGKFFSTKERRKKKGSWESLVRALLLVIKRKAYNVLAFRTLWLLGSFIFHLKIKKEATLGSFKRNRIEERLSTSLNE